jgi:hypothetical protein
MRYLNPDNYDVYTPIRSILAVDTLDSAIGPPVWLAAYFRRHVKISMYLSRLTILATFLAIVSSLI